MSQRYPTYSEGDHATLETPDGAERRVVILGTEEGETDWYIVAALDNEPLWYDGIQRDGGVSVVPMFTDCVHEDHMTPWPPQ